MVVLIFSLLLLKGGIESNIDYFLGLLLLLLFFFCSVDTVVLFIYVRKGDFRKG